MDNNNNNQNKTNPVNKASIISTPLLAKTNVDRISGRIEKEKKTLEKEMNTIPEGKLYIRYRGNLILFTERSKDKLYGITRNQDLVHMLARREYLELHVELLDQILYEGWNKNTEKIIAKLYPAIEALLKKFEDAGLDLDPITMTPNQRIWNSDRHSKSSYKRDELKYPTKRGRVYMRSKSEQAIGDLLEMLHIPYRYEAELTIHNRTYHPDFIIMMPDGRLVILEHVGRMDLRQYDEDLVTRLQAYDSIGLMIGRSVFLSFEHDTKDEVLIKEVIFQLMTAEPVWNRILQSAAIKAGCKFTAS